MAKIVLYLNGNCFHANMPSEKLPTLIASKAGLDVVGRSGIPVVFSYQKIDAKLGFYENWARKYSSIEICHSTHGHGLFTKSWLPSLEIQKWEVENGVNGNIPITFFSEFYCPSDPHIIPTEFFWVLESQSFLYSHTVDIPCCDIELQEFPKEALGINYGGKIGIIMKSPFIDDFLNKYFTFQRMFDEESLKSTLDEIEKIANMTSPELVVIPMDIEAPWVGSFHGEKCLERLFSGIQTRGLSDAFVPVSSVLDTIRDNTIKSKRPHRSLNKWSEFEVQQDYMTNLSQIHPITHREKLLFSIASCSDLAAGLWFKIRGSKKPIRKPAVDENGKATFIDIGYSQDVIDIQMMAYKAIVEGKTFQTLLEENKKGNGLFFQKMTEYAKRKDL